MQARTEEAEERKMTWKSFMSPNPMAALKARNLTGGDSAWGHSILFSQIFQGTLLEAEVLGL